MTLPVRTVTRPAALAGQANGRINPDRLRSATTPGGTATLVAPAAAAWVALCGAAEAAGHVLVPYSTYRSYESQEKLFLARYSTAYKANTDRKQWQGKTWYRHAGPTTAAPGTSNHGWGLAIDVRVMRGGKQHPIDNPAVAWLLAGNAVRHGFSWEIQSEPWHLRYFAGDHPPITAPIEEDDLDANEKRKLDEVHAALVGDTSPLKQVLDAARLSGPTHARILAALGISNAAIPTAALAAEIADLLDDDLAAAVANELARRLS